MNAQTIISHRMFVAALSHDASEETRKRRSNGSLAATSNRARGARNPGNTISCGPVAHQLLLLSDAVGFQPTQA